MNPTIHDLSATNLDQDTEAPRVSTEPVEGYVLEPWSGLYVETEIAHKNRLAAKELA